MIKSCSIMSPDEPRIVDIEKGLSESLWHFFGLQYPYTPKPLKLSNLEFWRKRRRMIPWLKSIWSGLIIDPNYFDRVSSPSGEIIWFYRRIAGSNLICVEPWTLLVDFSHMNISNRKWKIMKTKTFMVGSFNLQDWGNVFWCTCVIWFVVMNTLVPLHERRLLVFPSEASEMTTAAWTKHTASNRFRWLTARNGPLWFKYFACVF